MHIIKQLGKPVCYAVFDGQNFLAENLTQSDLEVFFTKRLRDYLADFIPTISYFEAELLAGRIKCCDCNVSLSPVEYQTKWPVDRQRCGACYAS